MWIGKSFSHVLQRVTGMSKLSVFAIDRLRQYASDLGIDYNVGWFVPSLNTIRALMWCYVLMDGWMDDESQ